MWDVTAIAGAPGHQDLSPPPYTNRCRLAATSSSPTHSPPSPLPLHLHLPLLLLQQRVLLVTKLATTSNCRRLHAFWDDASGGGVATVL
ncbi:unnamed protein product [Cuscuta europaea]|uniref:Uncharacterized protein n=1 Tax=Cuscuta europaea TaxID=41803 RepID=A0A9P0ZET6_CUSEU|nr:unnamed protein product [Cuscuta europaea]